MNIETLDGLFRQLFAKPAPCTCAELDDELINEGWTCYTCYNNDSEHDQVPQ